MHAPTIIFFILLVGAIHESPAVISNNLFSFRDAEDVVPYKSCLESLA